LHLVTEKVTIVTKMITPPRSYDLSHILFGKTRRAVLSLLYDHADDAFYLRQIVRATGAGLGPVQREMKQLVDAGIINRTVRGKQVFYQANPESPIFAELKSLIDRISRQDKAVGHRRLESDAKAGNSQVKGHVYIPKDKLADFCRRHHIRRLALFGSVLRDDFRPDSDVDVLVEFEPGYVPGFDFVAIEDELSEMLARKVDLRTPQDLSHYFREQVVREAKALYVAG
jgi:predicted nucleotidyltransferase